MAKDRLRREIAQGVKTLRYIARCEAKGIDVSQLEESREKRTASLIRHKACFLCGTVQTAKESLALWEQDRMGSECRRRYAGLSLNEALLATLPPTLQVAS